MRFFDDAALVKVGGSEFGLRARPLGLKPGIPEILYAALKRRSSTVARTSVSPVPTLLSFP
ncbi:MAG: hypothetical protein WA372_13490, partial [Candidatus Sulfotelmatobacter sp.]